MMASDALSTLPALPAVPSQIRLSWGRGRSWYAACVVLALSALPTRTVADVVRQPSARARLAHGPAAHQCVVIDNDYDIDDMMAMPLVIANRRVAAIVQTEGVTLPVHAAPAAHALINHSDLPVGASPIPIVVGGHQMQPPDPRRWPWVGFFRAMMNRSNGLLAVQPRPWPQDPAYPLAVARAVANCQRVTVLLTAPFTSFIRYGPLITHKLDRVVITGTPLDDRPGQLALNTFNCLYDLEACRVANGQMQATKSFYVDLPHSPDCRTLTANKRTHCYTSSYAMVAGHLQGEGRRSGGLLNQGLPGRLKRALINTIRCASLYTTPQASTRPCSSLSTWEPAAAASGPADRVLFWDQSTALFLLDSSRFAFKDPDAQSAGGVGHYEPRLVDGSHHRTANALRAFWTDATNRGAKAFSPVAAHD